MEPRGGGVTYPIVIRGYARTFEANVQAWIEQHEAMIASTKVHATAADWATTWGEFELTIPHGPDGDVTLFVGEESAKDGAPIGVRIPLRAASGETAGGR
jgi:NAD(P)H-flavin reductase